MDPEFLWGFRQLCSALQCWGSSGQAVISCRACEHFHGLLRTTLTSSSAQGPLLSGKEMFDVRSAEFLGGRADMH